MDGDPFSSLKFIYVMHAQSKVLKCFRMLCFLSVNSQGKALGIDRNQKTKKFKRKKNTMTDQELFRSLGFDDPRFFDNPSEAVDRATAIYQRGVIRKLEAAEALKRGKPSSHLELSGRYPIFGMSVDGKPPRVDGTQSYGFCKRGRGVYASTVTQPGVFGEYWRENLGRLLSSHPDVKIAVGISSQEIPLDFALDVSKFDEAVRENFDRRPRLKRAVCWANQPITGDFPLAPFPAMDTDNGLSRLAYYTGLKPEDIQETVLITNYDEFLYAFEDRAREQNGESTFVIPDSFKEDDDESQIGMKKHPQFPAFSLKKPNRKGITVIRIGVGSSNAATLMTYLAPSRPSLVLMVGHCAAGRPYWQQPLDSYVLGRAYHRNSCPLAEPGVMLVPLDVKLPEIDEINRDIYWSVGQEHGLEHSQIPTILTGGTIVQTSYRPWDDLEGAWEVFSRHKPVGIEMETGTVVAAGYYYRIPYGVCHIVTDHPIEGRVKTRMEARRDDRVRRHLNVVLRAVEKLQMNSDDYQSRSIRDAWMDPPFR